MVDVTKRFKLTDLELGKRYSRDGLGIGWLQTGIYSKNENYIILFVTLEGDYEDYFVSKVFYWYSQHKQDINSKIIKEIQNKERKVILFIRKESKIKNKTQEFLYAGELEYITYDKNTKNPVLMEFESLDYGINELSEIYSWKPKNRIEEEIGSNTKVVLTKTTGLNNITQKQIDCLKKKTSLLEEDIKDILYELENKKQIILQGPPGTGKTYVANEIVKCFGLKKDMVQFHESYSYEEFIEGYKPSSEKGELKFSVKDGRFKKFVKELSNNFDYKNLNVGDFILEADDEGVRRFGVVRGLCECEQCGQSISRHGIDWVVFPEVLKDTVNNVEFGTQTSLESKKFFNVLESLVKKNIKFWLVNSNHTGDDGNSWGKCSKYNIFHVTETSKKGRTIPGGKAMMDNVKDGDVVLMRKSSHCDSSCGKCDETGLSNIYECDYLEPDKKGKYKNKSKFEKILDDDDKSKNFMRWTNVNALLYFKKDFIEFHPAMAEETFYKENPTEPGQGRGQRKFKNIHEEESGEQLTIQSISSGVVSLSNRGFYDYFRAIICNEQIWNNLTKNKQNDVIRYLVTAYSKLGENGLVNDSSNYWYVKVKNSKENAIFIIDEINRGRTSSILGELLYLLEYRGEEEEITLPYSGEKFSIPDNLWVVGTMNTADRNIVGMAEYALRRRFAFFTLEPNPNLLNMINDPIIRKKAKAFLNEINEAIKDQKEYLGEGYAVGHSYFMKSDLDEEGFRRVIKYHVGPLVEEYCKVVDNADKMKEILKEAKKLGL